MKMGIRSIAALMLASVMGGPAAVKEIKDLDRLTPPMPKKMTSSGIPPQYWDGRTHGTRKAMRAAKKRRGIRAKLSKRGAGR